MPKWEVCKIEDKLERYVPSGFISSGHNFFRFVAIADTPLGRKMIDQSEVYESASDAKLLEQRDEERARLVGRLLAEGWEPIQSESGEVTTFRRAIPGT